MVARPIKGSRSVHRAALAAFEGALRQELHALQRWPNLTWQQLYNRLQWEDEPFPEILEPELQRRSASGATPWLRTRTPYRESEDLICTLAGHKHSVNACAFSPDGTRVVSASSDGTLKLWDADTGQELATLAHDAFFMEDEIIVDGIGGVRACTFSPDGTRVVSASDDRTLRLWDAETGQELAMLAGHTNWINACAFSPDGTRVVSASRDGTLKLWDADTGAEVATLPLLGPARTVAHHPWVPMVACGDLGGALYFADLKGMVGGPIVVTAVDHGNGRVVRCPACGKDHDLRDGWMGRRIECPTPDCDLRLKVNPFIAGARPATGGLLGVIRRWWNR